MIRFHSLTLEHLRTIARLQLESLAARLKRQNAITLRVQEDALDLICREGYSKVYNARPLQRAIEQLVAKPLSKLILEGMTGALVVRLSGDRIEITPQPETTAQG